MTAAYAVDLKTWRHQVGEWLGEQMGDVINGLGY